MAMYNNMPLAYEKCHLAIYRDMQGKFNSFQWIPSEKHSLEEITDKINEYNKEMTEQRPDTGRMAELVTDQLIREICAYAHKILLKKIQDESGETARKEARERIRRAIEHLEDAVSDLDD